MMWRNHCFKFSIITAFLHFMISLLYLIDREVVLVLIRDRQSSVLKPSQIQHS